MLGGFLAKVFHQPAAAMTVVGMVAVFWRQRQSTIATLIMVTEMTGDYSLLAPAALSILLSYLIQSALSAHLKYRSLYEAQVPIRTNSPAHYIEHLEAVLRLLSEQLFSVPATVTHLDLRLLLASGVPVDLPGEKQMIIGILRTDRSYVGKPIREYFSLNKHDDVEIVTVFRKGKTLLPHDELVLKAGDRLLAITSPASRTNSTNTSHHY